MTEIDTLIGVAGTLIGTLLGSVATYFFEERKAKRELALRPLDDRRIALNKVFGVLTDSFFELRGAILRFPKSSGEYNDRVVPPIKKLEKTVYENALYLSSIWQTVTGAVQAFADIGLALQIRLPDINPQTLPPASAYPINVKAFESAYFKAGNAIGLTLGIANLEEELQNSLGTPGVQDPSQPPP